MQALRIVMLLAALPVCYLLFYHPKSASQRLLEESAKVDSALSTNDGTPPGRSQPTPAAHSQYKRDIDQAHEAAKQMQARRAEADSIP